MRENTSGGKHSTAAGDGMDCQHSPNLAIPVLATLTPANVALIRPVRLATVGTAVTWRACEHRRATEVRPTNNLHHRDF